MFVYVQGQTSLIDLTSSDLMASKLDGDAQRAIVREFIGELKEQGWDKAW
jgi:hypothetical protein